MMWRPACAFVAGGLAAFTVGGCSGPDHVSWGEAAATGSAQLALRVGDIEIDTATAVLSREGDTTFETATQTIDVQGQQGVVSVYFGDLPAGPGYSIELRAGDCSGSAEFSIEATTTTLVEVTLLCEGDAREDEGSVQISGTFEDTGSAAQPDCDLIVGIVAAPSIQVGAGADSAIEVMLKEGVTASGIGWVISAESPKGVLRPSAASPLQASFDCRMDGRVEVVATVQAMLGERACTEQARAVIECVDQPDPCADGACDRSETGETPELTAPEPTAPELTAPEPDTSASTGACGDCTLTFCSAKLDAVNERWDSVAPILACMLGEDWQATERIGATSCANSDVFGCYCGSVAALDCGSRAPSTVDGQCRAEILAGTGCSDTACVQSSLLSPENPSGIAAQYVQCQQDFCYDLCFNP